MVAGYKYVCMYVRTMYRQVFKNVWALHVIASKNEFFFSIGYGLAQPFKE